MSTDSLPGPAPRTVPGFRPAPGRAPMRRILARQTVMELALTLRRGESLLLTLVIPVLLLIGATRLDALRLPTDDRVGYLVPGVLALAVMSTAFTGQAISTGFDESVKSQTDTPP